MTTTDTETSSAYERQVAQQYDKLRHDDENGNLRWFAMEDYTIWRHDISSFRAKVARAYEGLVLGSFTISLVLVAVLVSVMPDDQFGWGIPLGALPWLATWRTARAILAGQDIDASLWGYGVHHRIELASQEFERAAEAGLPGGRKAVDTLNGLEVAINELLEQELLYASTVASARRFPHQADYETAVDNEWGKVRELLLQITAEVTATAAMLFKQRPNLLVPVGGAVEPLDVPLFRLSEQTAKALADARKSFAAISSAQN
jgi:hypothetical protein